jgi:hypothetical protein
MKAQEVVDRVLADPEYAADLTRKISDLASTGVMIGPHNDDKWQEVLSVFADTPEELARLSTLNSEAAGSTTWTVTVTSVLTTTATPTSPITVTSITTITTAQ